MWGGGALRVPGQWRVPDLAFGAARVQRVFAHAQASLKSWCHAWGGWPRCAGKLRRCTQMIRGRLRMFNMNPFIANGCALRFATWKSRSTVRSCQARTNCSLKTAALKRNRDTTTRTNCSWKGSLLTRNRDMTTSNDKNCKPISKRQSHAIRIAKTRRGATRNNRIMGRACC